MALAGAGGMIGRSADREARARGIAGARLERDAARDAAEARMAAEERDAEREDAELELRRMLVGSQAGENEAQAARLRALALSDEARRAAELGDAEALRATVRSRINVIQYDPTREAWRQGLLDELDRANGVQAIMRILSSVEGSDPRRGSGNGPGGAGGGGGTEEVIDNGDGTYTTRRTPGARPRAAAPVAPTADPEYAANRALFDAEAAGIAAQSAPGTVQHPQGFDLAFSPAPRPGARPRPARPAPQPAPVPATAAAPAGVQAPPAATGTAPTPEVIGTAAEDYATRAARTLARLNVAPADRSRIVRRMVAAYANPRTRNAAEAELRGYDQQLVTQQAPPSEAIAEHWRERVELPLQTSRQADVLIATLRRQAGEIRGAMLTPALLRSESQSDLVATITRQIREVVKSFAGAAVTPQEMQGVLTAMGADTETLLANPQIIINAFQRARDANYRIARANAATFSPETRGYFGRQARGTRAGGQ
jgi:hypothetical protein